MLYIIGWMNEINDNENHKAIYIFIMNVKHYIHLLLLYIYI